MTGVEWIIIIIYWYVSCWFIDYCIQLSNVSSLREMGIWNSVSNYSANASCYVENTNIIIMSDIEIPYMPEVLMLKRPCDELIVVVFRQ